MRNYFKRNVIRFIPTTPSTAHSSIEDVQFDVLLPQSVETSVRMMIVCAHNCAGARNPGNEFTLNIDIPGTDKDIDTLRNGLMKDYKTLARLVCGELYPINEFRLGGRLTFRAL